MRAEPDVVVEDQAFELPRLCRYFSELSPQPMVAVEGTTHIVRHLNEAFARLVGKDRGSLIGRPFAEAVPEGENNGCLGLLNRVYGTGTPESLLEQQHVQAAPSYWSYVVWAILGSDDHPAGVMIQVTDVTEGAIFRRQAIEMNQALMLSSVRQLELTETADKLNASLHASEVEYRTLFETSELQSTALADLHRRKDEFLAMLSHELRNPLAPIANAVQLLRLQPNEGPLQQQARIIIERQVAQLTRLVDDLMEVSRITTGRVQLRLERVMMNTIVERAVETARPLIDRHKHELTVTLSPEPIWLYADPTRLEQVLINLLTNAGKYTLDAGHIALAVEQEGDECVVRVRDTGVGIAPELLPRVFDLFTQAERSLDRSQGGLGIGLALVQRLVELHRGRVEAHSSLGQGSEFVVRLPVVALPEMQPALPGTEILHPAGTCCRVLVVDDNIDAAESLALLVSASGHDVWTAHDGTTALQAAVEYRPDLVLLDIGLPGMNGYEVAKRLRRELGLEGVVLVAVTGYGQEADRQISLEAGFDHHLVKPADFQSVQAILTTISHPLPASRRILVVDDRRDAAYLVGKLLEALGQKVRIVADGAAALAAVQLERPDLMISDIMMPGMNGYELVERLKATPGFEGVVCVALTGGGQNDHEARARSAGFDHLLLKPASLDALRTLLLSLPVSHLESLPRGDASAIESEIDTH